MVDLLSYPYHYLIIIINRSAQAQVSSAFSLLICYRYRYRYHYHYHYQLCRGSGLIGIVIIVIKALSTQVTDMFQLCTPWTGQNPGVLVKYVTSNVNAVTQSHLYDLYFTFLTFVARYHE